MMNLTQQRWLEDYRDTAVFHTVPASKIRGRHRADRAAAAVWPVLVSLALILSGVGLAGMWLISA